jgi:hypothetical protein
MYKYVAISKLTQFCKLKCTFLLNASGYAIVRVWERGPSPLCNICPNTDQTVVLKVSANMHATRC